MKKNLRLTLLTAACTLMCVKAVAQTNPVTITSLVSTQRVGTMYVDITYNLVDPDNLGAYILVECSSDAGSTYGVPIYALTGDAAFLVPPGNGKHIVWDAWRDWAGNYTTNARIRLTADASFKGVILNNTNPPPATNLVWIPSGSYSILGGLQNIYISFGFWMGRFEVTQGEFAAIMTNNPSAFTVSSNRPVDSVTWDEAVLYCQRLNTREQAAGRLPAGWSYRLPTEAEWEYACRAGTTTTYYFGDSSAGNRLPFFGWYNFNSGSTTHDVGGRTPNRWGLFDMYGNVREWCSDWVGYLSSGNFTDPQGPPSDNYGGGSSKITRGGSWADNTSSGVLASGRCGSICGVVYDSKTARQNYNGFRVVLAPNP